MDNKIVNVVSSNLHAEITVARRGNTMLITEATYPCGVPFDSMHSPLRGKKKGKGSMSSPAVPATLLAIPEILEIDQLIMRGSLAPDQFLEATLPPLSREQMAALEPYLQALEETEEFVTDFLFCSDKVLITIVPIAAVALYFERALVSGQA